MINKNMRPKYHKLSRLRRQSWQITRDSNLYKTSVNHYLTRIIGTSKYEDKRKGRDFSLTRAYLYDVLNLQNNRCFFTNLEMVHDSSLYAISIDRIDNNIGHVVGNVNLCCLGINLARNVASIDEINQLIKCIRGYDFEPKNVISRNFISVCRRNCYLNDVLRGLDNDITTDYIINLYFEQNGACALSGIKIAPYKDNIFSLSIDRINNNKGHVIGNVRLVLKSLNRSKKNRSDVEFLKFLEDIKNA